MGRAVLDVGMRGACDGGRGSGVVDVGGGAVVLGMAGVDDIRGDAVEYGWNDGAGG